MLGTVFLLYVIEMETNGPDLRHISITWRESGFQIFISIAFSSLWHGLNDQLFQLFSNISNSFMVFTVNLMHFQILVRDR